MDQIENSHRRIRGERPGCQTNALMSNAIFSRRITIRISES
jgi:hypothetical protein